MYKRGSLRICTLAGCAMKVFKTLFLSKDTIALMHNNLISTKLILPLPSSGWNILKQAKMST